MVSTLVGVVTDPAEEVVVTEPNDVFSDLEMDRVFLDLKSFLGLSFMAVYLESKKEEKRRIMKKERGRRVG